MLILIDDADLTKIRELYAKYPYDGVTTNPTILGKTGNPDPMDQLKKIRALIPEEAMLHAQVLSTETDDMVKEAKHMVDAIGGNMYIKVPVTANGLKAISILSKEGINVTATAIYGVMPAFMAAKAGAKFLAPYVNRLDNLGYNGVQISKIFIRWSRPQDMMRKFSVLLSKTLSRFLKWASSVSDLSQSIRIL